MTAQYWTITGNDIWRMEKREVFEFLNLITGEKMMCDNVTEVKDAKLLPVTMPKPFSRPVEPKVTQPEKTTEEKSAKKKSKYKGVVCYPNGRFHAQYWSKALQKVISLGTFDYELIAAAAVLEAKGDEEGAKRLRNEHEEGDRGQPARDTGQFPSEQ